jgi:hypothetical protein
MTTKFVMQNIREARLAVSPPEQVASELGQEKFLYRGTLQESLLARNNSLIDLALAQHTEKEEILSALYQRSLVQPKDCFDASYLLGLKISCLSNEHVHFGYEACPKRIDAIFGSGEFERLVTKGNEGELAALLSNPKFFAMLNALYKNEGIFSSLSDDRRRLLVHYSIENPRLALREDSWDCPDIDHYSVHKAILSMLATAPVTHDWAYTLFKLLLVLDPKTIASPDEPVTSIIERWSDLPPSEDDATYTNLSLKDELCCLISAMYGASFSGKKSSIFRNRKLDIFLRCADYGRASVTARKMKAGYKRDERLYLLAVLQKDSVFFNPQLRKLLEEQLGYKQRLIERYRHRCQQISSSNRMEAFPVEFNPRPVSDELIQGDLSPEPEDLIALLRKNEDSLKEISKTISWMFWGVIIFGIVIFGLK